MFKLTPFKPTPLVASLLAASLEWALTDIDFPIQIRIPVS
jgi:hypothetical protein